MVVRAFSLLTLASMIMVPCSAALEIPFGGRISIDTAYLDPVSIAAGDFDGDGLDDLVVAGKSQGSLAWWRNLGDGAFQRYEVVATATDINDVEVADVNRDGHLDVVVTAGGSTNAVGWYENDGTPMDGGWPLRLVAISFDLAIGTAVGDVNGDGRPDIAGVAGAGTVSVALNNNGTGIGWSYETVDADFPGATWISLGDIDSDGNLDVMAAAYYTGEIAWWSRGPGGTWTKHSVRFVPWVRFVELADMDSDGDLDAISTGDPSSVAWWENDGDGGTWTGHGVGDTSGESLASYASDLDGDGDTDVLFTAVGPGGIGWFENTDGHGTSWIQHVVDSAASYGRDIQSLDFDNDGDLDLVGLIYGLDEVAAWENQTIHRAASYSMGMTMGGPVGGNRDVEAVDYDGDGCLDVVYADAVAAEVGWFAATPGSGSGWTKNLIAVGAARAVSAADINGDGRAEVVSGFGGRLYWWERLPAGGTIRYTIADDSIQVDALATSDFDGDGDVDVVVASWLDGIGWYENQGSGTWVGHDVDSAQIWDPDCLTVADVDGDGDPDLAYADSGSVRWVSNELETPGFSFSLPHDVATGLDSPRSVAAGDMDADGDIDIVAGITNTGEVLWWANSTGDGAAWGPAEVIAQSMPKPQSVGVADVDRDGELEVAVGAYDEGLDQGWFGFIDRDATGAWIENPAELYSSHFPAMATGDFFADGTIDLATGDGRWWPDLGGHATLAAADISPAVLEPGVRDGLIRLDLVHEGSPGDADVELAEMKLLLTDHAGTPLTTAEIDAVLQGVYIYADTNLSGSLDPGLDTVVQSIDVFSATAGVETIAFDDDDLLLQAGYGVAKRYFVAIAFESVAALHLPSGIQLTVPARSAVIEDADHDIPLDVAYWPDTSSSVVVPEADPSLIFADGFESGDVTEWDASQP